MARRVDGMMDEDSWGEIHTLPRGGQSRAVDAAVPERFGAARRRDASARMDELRERLPAIGTDRIVRWIKEGRERRLP